MHFDLVDAVLERHAGAGGPGGDGGAGEAVGVGARIVTLKQVSAAEEYLGDHFPGFPVLPGVMMVEAMVQAGRKLLEGAGDGRLVLGGVRALKYGRFVRPGEGLRVEVTVHKRLEGGAFEMKGEATVISAGGGGVGVGGGEGGDATAVAGRFVLRPLRLGPPAAGEPPQ